MTTQSITTSPESETQREFDEFTAEGIARYERIIREAHRTLLITKVKRILIIPFVCLRMPWAIERWEITYPDICGERRYALEEFQQNLWKLHSPKPEPGWQEAMADVRGRLRRDPSDKEALEKLDQLNASDVILRERI